MMREKRNYNDDILTLQIIGVCYEVHNKLGPGFIEKVYLTALKLALRRTGLNYQSEKEFSVLFDNEIVGKFSVNLVVEDKVIVGLKAVEGSMPKIFESQILSYLKASNMKVGLLVNFGNSRCVVRRLVLLP